MRAFLALPAADRRAALEQTAQQRDLVVPSVEKDFWVTWMLGELFALPELAPHLTFKGGTSLSKAWGLIDRFSEDIDLTIDRAALGFGGSDSPERAESRKQRARRLNELKAACRAIVSGKVWAELSSRIESTLGSHGWAVRPDENDAEGQTLLFDYPTLLPVPAGSYIAPRLKIEFGARADPWPAEEKSVQPLVAEAFPQLFATPACTVRALVARRTFWEKAMLLHEENFRPLGRARLARMARHYYDLHRLIQQGVGAEAVDDADLFAQVAAHRSVYFAQNWVDYDTLKRGSLRVTPLPGHEQAWREDYAAMQVAMFSTPPPSFDEVLASVRGFEQEFNAAVSRP